MYACGLRIGEAATLEIGTIDGDNGLLRIIGKGNKERLVPLPEPMLLKLRRLWFKTHKNPLWLVSHALRHQPGRPQHTQSYLRGRRSSGRYRFGDTHSLRHGYATRLLENGDPSGAAGARA